MYQMEIETFRNWKIVRVTALVVIGNAGACLCYMYVIISVIDTITQVIIFGLDGGLLHVQNQATSQSNDK